MNISIFGLGYVGCISLGCLARNGHRVMGVDVSKTKIELINQGRSPIVENEINAILSEQHQLGRISATTNGVDAVINTDVSFICVGTPSSNNGHLDLQTVFRVAEEIAKGLKSKRSGFHVVAIRSTVLPGTNGEVSRIIQDLTGLKPGSAFAVISNPEFLREGSAVKDYYTPAYTLVGADDNRSAEIMKDLYKEIKAPFVVTDIKTAEIIKYVNNAFHALKITFANEVGNICKLKNIDAQKVMEIFCMDKKLNLSPCYLRPGFAYGGSCLPKDLKGLRTMAHDLYLETPVIENIERSNEAHKKHILERIVSFEKKKIGFLGLSFKAGTDDLRNSPIVDILESLLGKGYEVMIFDKNVNISKLIGANRDFIMKKLPAISRNLVDDPSILISNSEVIVVVNNEKEFPTLLSNINDETTIFDLVNLPFVGRDKKKNYIGLAW